MRYSILTSEGWKKYKNLTDGMNIYTVKDRTIILRPVESIKDIEENEYSYSISNQNRLAFDSTKVFDKNKELVFKSILSDNFYIPLTVNFKTNIVGIEKSTKDIIKAVKNKITYSWVRLLCKEDTQRYLTEWENQYNGLTFTSDKEAADLQILLVRIGYCSYIKGNQVIRCEKSGTTESYQLIGKTKTKLPIIDGEFAHYFVRDESRNVFLI